MPKLTYNCPICTKVLKLKSEIKVGDKLLYVYECGHVFPRDITHISKDTLDFTSKDGSGKVARPYQEDGVKFIIETGFNAILADQMRLGKTPQVMLAYANKHAELSPALYIVKSANLWQWIREHKVWVDTLPMGIYPIIGTEAFIPLGFSTYIISMDTFGANSPCKCGHRYHETKCKRKGCECRVYQSNGCGTREQLKNIPFKLVIVDEAHSFKNTSSNRSQALVDFMHFLNTGESQLDLHFTCSRCNHEWNEQGKQEYDKRIGHVAVSKSSRCPKCQNWCYMRQQHSETDRWRGNPEAVEKVKKLLLLAAPESNNNEHERELAQKKADAIKEQYNLEEEKREAPCGLVLLTGTPILNRADEYFVPLNLVNPDKFSSHDRFRRDWLVQDIDPETGKYKPTYSKVKSYMQEQFKATIKPFMLRREKEDVYKELPKLNKTFTVIEPEKGAYAAAYNKVLDKMSAELAFNANPSFFQQQTNMMALRRICGMMKINFVAERMEELIDEGITAKQAIGIHHETVRDVLFLKLGGEQNCFKLSGEENSDRKDLIMRTWEDSNKQFLIINMLAGGVGMDFHYCDNVVVMERMWNAEMERQFEFRFYNPDMSIKKNPTDVEYVIAKGTLDEWWYNMIEDKKQNVDPLVYNNWDLTKDVATFKELCEITVANRL